MCTAYTPFGLRAVGIASACRTGPSQMTWLYDTERKHSSPGTSVQARHPIISTQERVLSSLATSARARERAMRVMAWAPEDTEVAAETGTASVLLESRESLCRCPSFLQSIVPPVVGTT